MKYDVFISYIRNDKALVHLFVEEINQALGIDCRIDLNKL